MPETLSDSTIAIFRALAGERADRFAIDFVAAEYRRVLRTGDLTLDAAADRLEDPIDCLKIIAGHYLFSRRGRDKGDLSDAAAAALGLAAQPDNLSHEPIWPAFEAACESRNIKASESNHRTALEGLVELAERVRSLHDASVAVWLEDRIVDHGRLEECFNALVEIRGLGPKVASSLLRDFVFLFELNESVQPIDLIFLLPVDKWAREIAPILVEEDGVDQMADWVLAGKLVKYARRAGVCPVRFSMGLAYFGLREVRHPAHFGRLVRQLGASRATLR